MPEIKFNITDEKLLRLVTAIKVEYPIPQIPDPNWIDPYDGSEAPLINEYTDNQWLKICIKNILTDKVYGYERNCAVRLITKDDNLIT